MTRGDSRLKLLGSGLDLGPCDSRLDSGQCTWRLGNWLGLGPHHSGLNLSDSATAVAMINGTKLGPTLIVNVNMPTDYGDTDNLEEHADLCAKPKTTFVDSRWPSGYSSRLQHWMSRVRAPTPVKFLRFIFLNWHSLRHRGTLKGLCDSAGIYWDQ